MNFDQINYKHLKSIRHVALFFLLTIHAGTLSTVMGQLIIAPSDKIGTSLIKPGEPLVPVRKVSTGGVIHRFHDTSPLSPSGKYMALFRVPFEDRYPKPGEIGEVLLVDMESGDEKVVAKTRGWEMQVGANVQWGANDEQLFYNDVDTTTWDAYAVMLNPFTGESKKMDGTVFFASQDGKQLASYNLINSRHAQYGYGVVLPDEKTKHNLGPVSTDSIFIVDTESGKAKSIATIKDVYEKAVPSIKVPNPEEYEFYFFKIMWNPQGTRIMTLVMMKPNDGSRRKVAIITMLPDGSDIRTAITHQQYAKGGHHMAWAADGVHISQNLNVDGKEGIEIITVKYDGSDMKEVFPIGSGHPSFHPKGLPLIVTDSYWHEPITNKDGFVPLRLINVDTQEEQLIASIYVPVTDDSYFRVDPHPAWDRSGRYVIFNAFEDNTRCVFIADLKEIIDNLQNQ